MPNVIDPQVLAFLRRYNIGGYDTGTGAGAGALVPGGASATYGQPAQQKMTPAANTERYIPPMSQPAQSCQCPDCAGTMPIQHGGGGGPIRPQELPPIYRR